MRPPPRPSSKNPKSAWITSNQIEAARIAMTRYTKRGGKVWIKIFPDKPVTQKPAETRMVIVGGEAVRVLDNNWTVVTVDGSLSAHYENTIAITDGEPEILTMAEDL